jgi:beta-galactosidase/beta-glucuronidase
MYPHRIRLRGPWECEPPGQRITMPCRWRDTVLGEFAGVVRCRRRFGLPRQIDTHERLWLTFDGLSDAGRISLNGNLLGKHGGAAPLRFEVTGLLQERNELLVEVESSDGEGGLWGEVALEITCSAYLRNLCVRQSGEGQAVQLHVTGEVAGTADRPLDLYLLLDNRTMAYQAVEPGRSFTLTSELIGEHENVAAGEVRVELVNGGSLWYQWTAPQL